MEDSNNINRDLENLREFAPLLSGMEKKGSFAVPEGYFNELPGHIQRRIFLGDIDDQNSFVVPESYFEVLPKQTEQSIFLENLKEKDAFGIPDNYFDTLAEKIHGRISAESRVIALREWPKRRFTYMAAAASVLLIIGMFGLFKKLEMRSGSREITIALSENDKTFIIEHAEIYDIDETMLAEQIPEEGITELSLEGLAKEDVLDYLSGEDLFELNVSVDEM